MRKAVAVAVTLLLVVHVMPVAAETMAYDSGKVVEIMRANLGAIRPLGGAIDGGDFTAAGLSFLKLAEGSVAMLSFSPPKGDAGDWQRINKGLASAALAGAQACLDGDAAAAKQALGQIGALNKEGHSLFR
jgi:hypothetical protein